MPSVNLGRVSIVPKGAWSNSNSYEKLDVVTYGGGSYIANKDVPAGTSLSTTEYWSNFVGSFNIGTVETVSASTGASAELITTSTGQTLNLQIPRGVSGNESIDDSKGEGDTDYVWSADKSWNEVNNLDIDINGKADVIVRSASGDVVSFDDGGDDLPVKSLIAEITAAQNLNGYDKPYGPGGSANLWDEDWELGIIGWSGLNADSTTKIRSKGYIPVSPETEYYIVSSVGLQIFYYDANKDFLSYEAQSKANKSITTPANAYYLRFYVYYADYGTTYKNDIAVNYPSTVTTYAPWQNICPITGCTGVDIFRETEYDAEADPTVSISWQTEAGAVYFGNLNVTTGVLTVEYERKTLTSFSGIFTHQTTGLPCYVSHSTHQRTGSNPVKMLSNMFVYNGGNGISTAKLYEYGLASGAETTVTFMLPPELTTLAQANQWLQNLGTTVEYMIHLTTPVTYQLTPTEVKTLLGVNCIWTSVSKVSVEYSADTSLVGNKNIADINALKSDKLNMTMYENKVEKTSVTANIWQDFPFKIEAGATYKITILTPSTTWSYRTRDTIDGPNIDSGVGIPYCDTPKTFTATADANYLGVNCASANASIRIEKVGTIMYDIDAIKGDLPIITLPPKMYAYTDRELNVYFDNICENAERYHFNVTCSKGKQMERCFTFTPADTDAGNYAFTLEIIDDEQNVIATATSTIYVTASTAGAGTTKTMILLGDSTVAQSSKYTAVDFEDDSMTLTPLGTRGTSPYLSEGRGGWTFQYYYSAASSGDIVNPFYNPSTHLFDADYYFTNSNIAKPDWFFIQLGINDTFSFTVEVGNAGLLNQVLNMKKQCDYMIDSIKTASSSTKIGIAMTIPPNHSQDAFGKAYQNGQTRYRYKRNNLIWVRRLIDTYAGRESEGIYLVPINTNLDTIYNMGLETLPVNARNTAITYQSPIANGGVHPVESGYQQIADVYMAFIKANL